jgi:hypothetical protein
MWKIIKWFIAFSVLGIAGWITFKWYTNTSDISVEAISLIPADAIYCITTDSPINAWREISGSGTWGHLQTNTYFASLTSSANTLDSIIRDNDLLSDLIGSRSLIVSAHLTGSKQYDFLFVVDLQQVSGIKFMNDYIAGLSTEDMRIQKEKYKEEELITFHNTTDNSNLYAAFPGSYLVASYSKRILTASMDAYRADSTQSKNSFLTIMNELSEPGLMKLYLNYNMLPEFISCYTGAPNEYANRLSQALNATALNVTLENDLIKASGHTFVNDSIESYLKTLAISGEGPTEFAEIAPQRTAFALALGFESFGKFFHNFEEILQQDIADYKAYRESLKQVENYLDINLQENFINWIGDEVALLELQSSGQGIDNETALIFKADNVEKARKDLAYIEKMVRRKTPVKFKAIDHRGYQVNYLHMKGLFRVLLGKFFARYDKPYYTVLNNFVIFSNHPQTLESIIDDYLDKNTLIQSGGYRDFKREFEDEGSVFVYVNTPVLFGSLKKLADNTTQVSMEKNKEYIISFQQLGFQLVPDEGGFKTIIAEKYAAPVRQVALAETPPLSTELPESAESPGPAPAEQTPIDVDPMALPYIYVRDLNKPSFTTYFPDSTVHFEVDLKNGFKDGAFTEYYESGKVKMKGHFKDDKRDGGWRLYNEEGDLVLRRAYENGELTKERIKD